MSRNRKTRGQVLIIILILLGVLFTFLLLSVFSARVHAVPIVKEAFWQIGNEHVSTLDLGEKVEAHIMVKATEEYVGSIVLKIRKDVSLWLDSDYQVSTVPVNLIAGEEKEIQVVFTPDQSSSGRLRGYFMEIDFQATGTKWVMENSYPPRLKVN